jgi:hypothetical protein
MHNKHLPVLMIEPAFYRRQFVLVAILDTQQAGWFVDSHPIIGFSYYFRSNMMHAAKNV